VSSINDLGIIMDEKMTFSEHVDVMSAKAFAMQDLSGDFRWSVEIFLKSLYTSLGHPKLEYERCSCSMMFVLTDWNACKGGLFYMLCVVWVGQTCMICHRMRTDAPFCILTPLQKGDQLLSGRVNSPNLLSVFDLITPRHPTRGTEFLRIDFHRTNYGLHEPMSGAMRQLVFFC
jgi:hypothetical protein